MAQETYLALTRKLDETQVTAQDTSGVVQSASAAVTPTVPTGPRKAVNTLLGGIVGVLMAMGGVWLVESRRASLARAAANADRAAGGQAHDRTEWPR